MKNIWMVFGKILLTLGMVQMLTGCFTIWTVNKSTQMKTETTRQDEFSDEITASFQYKNLQLTPEQKSSFTLPEQGIGFVGKNIIYFIQNGQDLLSLDQIFQTIPLRQADNKGIIDLEISPPKNAEQPTSFENSITLFPQKETEKLSPDEVNKLTQAGFAKKNNRYEKRIKISGLMFAKTNTNTPLDELKPLTETRKVQFYHMKTKEKINSDVFLLPITLPITLAVDVFLVIPIFGLSILAKAFNPLNPK